MSDEFRAATERAERAIAAVARAQEDGTYHPAMLQPVLAAQEEMRALVRRARAERDRLLDALAAEDPAVASVGREVAEKMERLHATGRHDEARALLRRFVESKGFDPQVTDAMVERRDANLH